MREIESLAIVAPTNPRRLVIEIVLVLDFALALAFVLALGIALVLVLEIVLALCWYSPDAKIGTSEKPGRALDRKN